MTSALALIDGRMPGSAVRIIDRIGSIAGENRNQNNYDQLYQVLGEIDVLQRVCALPWDNDAMFEYEPVVAAGGSNPEIIVASRGRVSAIEVKAPVLRHYRNNMRPGWQATARIYDPGNVEIATLPRDNPIKDALVSADRKFADLRTKRPDSVCILIIVWDELMNEPIASLVHPASGLFTPNTFDPEKRAFADIDAVLILPHARQLIEGPGNRRFVDGNATFAWVEFPFRPYILNPNSSRPDVVAELQEVFEADDQRGLLGAEYNAPDAVLWIDLNEERREQQ
jgi:hypothetical protein